MQRNGTARFTDADDYRASVREAKFDLVFNSQRDFQAQLTWLELRHLRLLAGVGRDLRGIPDTSRSATVM
jgi:hypothetical protein